MKAVFFAYSRRGLQTARRVIELLPCEEYRAYTIERLAGDGFEPLKRPSAPYYAEAFAWADALIFVGACGIAVRQIAPYVRDKRTDPAVLCIDELGTFVIPLLSGHIGGANDLAAILAGSLHAVAVITTATDINRRFSVDAWAAKCGFAIDSMEAAKAVSAAILEEDIPLVSDFPVAGSLPPGVILGAAGRVGISISIYKKEPFHTTLRLIPSVLHLGIGCRRGTAAETIRKAVDMALEAWQIDSRAVSSIASIDLKANEAGLLAYASEQKLPVRFYTAEELLRVQGEFTSSAFVKSVTGVDNVCERAALADANELIIKKTAYNGVTVAAAVKHLEVHFE